MGSLIAQGLARGCTIVGVACGAVDQARPQMRTRTGRIHGGGASPNRHSGKWTRDRLAKLGVAYESPPHASMQQLARKLFRFMPHAPAYLVLFAPDISFCSGFSLRLAHELFRISLQIWRKKKILDS